MLDNTDVDTSDLKRKPKLIQTKDLLSSGSTLLNLACSGRVNGALPPNKYVLLVGDSESGKTWFSLSFLAEAAKRKKYNNHRLILDDPEDGAMMDKAYYFGSRLEERIEPPAGDQENPEVSSTCEEFYDYLDDCHKKGTPYIYILDSENSLSTKKDIEKYGKQKSQRRSTRATKVDPDAMVAGNAKIHSARLRLARSRLRATGSNLIIISQTRANLDPFLSKFNPRKRSGGDALKFWADLEIWTSVKQNLTRKIKGKERQIGILVKVQVKKNRITGKKRTLYIPIYHSHGIDDTGSMIDYLVQEKHWKMSDENEIIKAPEFNFSGNRELLVSKIEEDDQEQELKDLVAKVWREIDEACEVPRKRRYD